MPTIFTHTFIAGAACKAYVKEEKPLRYWIIAMVCSVIPDADVIGFHFGVSYGSFFGHRGFFHSIAFAVMVAFIAVMIIVRDYRLFSMKWWRYVLFFSIIGVSHGIMDAFTNGGLGIALFSPITGERYFFSWTPIPVSPIGLKSFLYYGGLHVVVCEIVWIWLPLVLILFLVKKIKMQFDK